MWGSHGGCKHSTYSLTVGRWLYVFNLTHSLTDPTTGGRGTSIELMTIGKSYTYGALNIVESHTSAAVNI